MAGAKTEEAPLERVAFKSHIGPHAKGLALIDFLTKRFTYFNAEQWRHRIESQDVQVNGIEANAEQILSTGDQVLYFAMKQPEPKVPTHIPIVYQDQDLIVVNKPPHIPVHPTGRYLRSTLIHVLQKQTQLKFLILAHRLDRETSGLCVLSKTPLAKDKMYWAFYNGEVDKTYWGLVWGRPEPKSGIVDAPIGTSTTSKIRIKQAIHGRDAKTARTKYHTLGTKWIHAPEWTPPPWQNLIEMTEDREESGVWPVSLVECKPITGRTNQIRVHLTMLGCGIVGDKLYDPDEAIFQAFKDAPPVLENERTARDQYIRLSSELRRRLVLDAHALHARRLSFRHPRTGKTLTLEAPPPRSWHGLYDGR